MGDACSDLRYLALVLSEEGGGLIQARQLLRSCGSCRGCSGCLRLPMGEASGRKRLLDALELCVREHQVTDGDQDQVACQAPRETHKMPDTERFERTMGGTQMGPFCSRYSSASTSSSLSASSSSWCGYSPFSSGASERELPCGIFIFSQLRGSSTATASLDSSLPLSSATVWPLLV